MDKKLAIHMKMQTQYVLWKLTREQASAAHHKVCVYEDKHGHGYKDWEDTEEYKASYKEFTETDEGWKELWHRYNELLDEEMRYLRAFGRSMEQFTDGQIDEATARQMALSPRTEKQLEEVLLGKE